MGTSTLLPGARTMMDQQAAQRLIGDRIREAGNPRMYPARSFLFHEYDESNSVIVVDSGLVRIDRTSMSGRVALLDLASSGRVIGELGVIDDQPRSATASTINDTAVHHVTASTFRQMMEEDSELQLALLSVVAERVRSLSTQFVETSLMDAPARIAARLLRLVEIENALGHCRVEDDGTVDLRLPISQEELGQWSGLSREGAVKGLGTLRSIGLIETGRKRVKIHDLTGLERHADAN
ncbi:MAG: Crp/Fnr family transcriptional regulator [Actinomycetota bacterium]